MSQLSSALNKSEIDILIEAMSEWEAIGNHEFHVLGIVKKHPMPDEEGEQYDFIKAIKDHYKKREREIQESRTIRQERAILTKAKLVMIRQDLNACQLFENAQIQADDFKQIDEIAAERADAPTSDEKKRLVLAEFYIKDLGVWEMYQKFLADGGGPSTQNEKGEKTGSGWHHGNMESV